MKKIIFILFIITFTNPMLFAEKTSAQTDDSTTSDQAADNAASALVKAETFTGRIDSIWAEDDTKGTRSHISVRNNKGHPTVFTVASDAVIIGKDGSATAVTWIKENNVSIAYTIDENGTTKIAKSIKVLPD